MPYPATWYTSAARSEGQEGSVAKRVGPGALGPGVGCLQTRPAVPLPSCLTLDKLLDLRASLQWGDKKHVKKIK